jgi:hypothetical protein
MKKSADALLGPRLRRGTQFGSVSFLIAPRTGGQLSMASGEKFERHRQPWRQDEIQKLHMLAGKGMSLRAIAKALTRTEESVKDRAKADRLTITKLR